MDRYRLVGVAITIASAFGFASGTIVARPVYAAGVDWLGFLVWRFIIGATLSWLWVAARPSSRAALGRVRRRPAGIAVGLGVLFTLNAGTYFAGLQWIPASLAGVIVYIYPVLTAVLASRFSRRLGGLRPWAALGITMVGVVLALGGIPAVERPPLIGIVLVMSGGAIYSVYIILSARLSGERADRLGHEADPDAATASAAVTTALTMSGTAVTYLVVGTLAGTRWLPADIPAAAWPGLFGGGALGSFLAIQAFYAGSRRIGAANAALVSTVEPVFIVSMAAIFLGEHLAPLQLAGAALVIAGVIVAQTGSRGRGPAAGVPQPAMPMDAEVSG
jgi:drug/metabolite transporter (DMT)-like permease